MTDLYRVPAFCPECFRRAAIRAYPEQVLAARGMDPETPLVSLSCLNHDQPVFYPVTALDFQRARKEGPGRKKAA